MFNAESYWSEIINLACTNKTSFPSSEPTCSGRCDDGPDESFPCQCDDDCEERDDCCADYFSYCTGNVLFVILTKIIQGRESRKTF